LDSGGGVLRKLFRRDSKTEELRVTIEKIDSRQEASKNKTRGKRKKGGEHAYDVKRRTVQKEVTNRENAKHRKADAIMLLIVPRGGGRQSQA